MKKIRVFEAFAGYGSQALALQRLKDDFVNFDFEVVGISEIDKYAITAYNAIHGACPNFGDISKIDWNVVPDFDLFTYSFPCTDISIIGKQQGFSKGSNTRSSLLWECCRAIESKKPKYLLMENVKNLLSKKFKNHYSEWVQYLATQGYTTYTQVLDALDYNIPQHRERVFALSILGTYDYCFPNKIGCNITLDDVLECNVDDKYYLSDDCLKYFKRVNNDNSHNPKYKPLTKNDVAKTLTARGQTRIDGNYIIQQKYGVGRTRDERGRIKTMRLQSHINTLNTCPAQGSTMDVLVVTPKIEQVGNIYDETDRCKNRSAGRIYNTSGVCPSLRSSTGGNNTPIIIGRKHGFNNGCVSTVCPTNTSSAFEQNNVVSNNYGVRRLTPRECFRLMDVRDSDIDKLLSSGLSNTRLYALAGNSIVVSCLYYILKNLFIHKQMPRQLALFNL